MQGCLLFRQKDEMIIMPANEPHSVYAEENFKMLLVMIKG
jgi:quercetin dioxygenase-like cupin family protein